VVGGEKKKKNRNVVEDLTDPNIKLWYAHIPELFGAGPATAAATSVEGRAGGNYRPGEIIQ